MRSNLKDRGMSEGRIDRYGEAGDRDSSGRRGIAGRGGNRERQSQQRRKGGSGRSKREETDIYGNTHSEDAVFGKPSIIADKTGRSKDEKKLHPDEMDDLQKLRELVFRPAVCRDTLCQLLGAT